MSGAWIPRRALMLKRAGYGVAGFHEELGTPDDSMLYARDLIDAAAAAT